MKGGKVLWRQAPMVKVNSDFFVAHNGHRLGWHRFSNFAFDCLSQIIQPPLSCDIYNTFRKYVHIGLSNEAKALTTTMVNFDSEAHN